MKALHRGVFLVPLIAAVAGAPAMAQSWKFDLGVNGGYSWFTPSLDKDKTGLADGTAGAEVKFRPGWLVGSQIGYWFTPKIGLRLNGRYSDRPLTGTDMGDDNFIGHVNLWGATGDLLFRFKSPAPEFTSMEVLPYLAIGAGAKWHNPAGDNSFCHEPVKGHTYACGPFVTGAGSANEQAWALGEENEPAGLVGLGADWRLSKHVAIRTEISDQFYKPQIHAAVAPAAGGNVWEVPTGDVESKLTHEIALQAGLQFLFGLASVPVVAVAPPPPPPPAPTPPPPAPTVTRDNISVCVVDPAAPGGVRMQAATLVDRRDTVVVVSGTDRPFRETLPTVMVATNAPWYMQGQPLTMTVGKGTVEYAVYGSPRVIEASDIVYVGTINGFPVYADRDDVADVIDEINQLNQARAGTDLGVILADNRTLRNEFSDVKVLYVPTSVAGCAFQAVQRQEEVRKGGK